MKTKLTLYLALALILYCEAKADSPTNGLVAYYPFNGNANDESGNGNDGTVVGIPLTTDRLGFSNGCYDFNGNGYMNINNTLLLNNATAATISGWFLRRESKTTGFVVGAGDSRAGGDPITFVVRASLQVEGGFGDNALWYGVNHPGSPDLVVQPNTWYQFVQEFESTTSNSVYRLFLNGSLIAVSNFSYPMRIYYDTPMPV